MIHFKKGDKEKRQRHWERGTGKRRGCSKQTEKEAGSRSNHQAPLLLNVCHWKDCKRQYKYWTFHPVQTQFPTFDQIICRWAYPAIHHTASPWMLYQHSKVSTQWKISPIATQHTSIPLYNSAVIQWSILCIDWMHITFIKYVTAVMIRC